MEFGSDFHMCDKPFHGSATINTLFRAPQFYASGRMALVAIAQHEKWKRLWVPAYFCHEIINAWSHFIEICLYNDYPLEFNDEQIVHNLPYRPGDALLRMNYYGLRSHRYSDTIPVPVVEDHSHALNSEWALHSTADWCIASLRKTLPLAFGGILWSPKGKMLPVAPIPYANYDKIASERYRAMKMKTCYLQNGGNKETFRNIYISTEEGLDGLSKIAALDSESRRILHHLDILRWNEQKQHNWNIACECLTCFEIIGRDKTINTPFSIIIYMQDEQSRNQFRTYLIEHNIFPATLWNIPDDVEYSRCKDFSKRMLSIHCDARYSEQDILQMCEIINQYDTNH